MLLLYMCMYAFDCVLVVKVRFSFDNKLDDSWKSDVSRLECEIERVYYSGYGRVMMDDVCSRWGWIVWVKNGFRTLKI